MRQRFLRSRLRSALEFAQRAREYGVVQIFDLVHDTYVKTVTEQSALLRRERDVLQLTAVAGVSRTPLPNICLKNYELFNDVNLFYLHYTHLALSR